MTRLRELGLSSDDCVRPEVIQGFGIGRQVVVINDNNPDPDRRWVVATPSATTRIVLECIGVL